MTQLIKALVVPGGIGFLGYAGYQSVTHSFFMRREKLELHGANGKPVQLSDEMKNIQDEVITTLDWDVSFLANIKLFMTKSMDICSRGFVHGKAGTIIGIPRTFNIKHPKDINCWQDICQYYNVNIDQQSETGEELANSLILSKNAKKFAVAREIFLSDTYKLHFHLLFLAMPLYFFYVIFYYTQRKFTPMFRCSLYLATALLMFKFYWMATDFYTRRIENSVDEEAAQLGIEYAEGGLEFYDKLIQIRQVLYSVKGDKELGEWNKFLTSLRNTHVPLEQRKTNISQCLKEQVSDQNPELEV